MTQFLEQKLPAAVNWFQKFDDAGLAFLYQAERSGGGGSTFFKLVSR
jgi:hypothetical protein